MEDRFDKEFNQEGFSTEEKAIEAWNKRAEVR
jgi:hypothetical protein